MGSRGQVDKEAGFESAPPFDQSGPLRTHAESNFTAASTEEARIIGNLASLHAQVSPSTPENSNMKGENNKSFEMNLRRSQWWSRGSRGGISMTRFFQWNGGYFGG